MSIDKVNVAVSCRASVSCFPLCFFHLQATDECHSKTRPTAALLSWIRHASPSWHLITLHCQRIQMRPAGGHAVWCRATDTRCPGRPFACPLWPVIDPLAHSSLLAMATVAAPLGASSPECHKSLSRCNCRVPRLDQPLGP